MGAYLDKPIEEKNPTDGGNSACKWGACSLKKGPSCMWWGTNMLKLL